MLFDSFELVILDIEGTGAARCTAATNPPVALSDGPQQLTPAQFRELIAELRELAACLGKKIV